MTDDLVRWPQGRRVGDRSEIAVVTVSHNTCELVALLLWSNHRVLDCPTLGEVVVVDNGSTDGTPNLLDGAAQAGLCTLLTNHDNRYHGPGLNQALSYLARKAAVTGAHARWVWILDSDCVVARPDALAAASGAAGQTGASPVGEHQWDPRPSTERFGSHCLLLDPAATWREPIPPFDDGGDPTFSFLDSSAGLGLVSTDVPFLADGSVIHRARGTLAAVFAQQERTNHLYRWAVDHHTRTSATWPAPLPDTRPSRPSSAMQYPGSPPTT